MQDRTGARGRRMVRAGATALSLGLVLSACGGDEEPGSAPSAAASPSASASPSSEASASPGASASPSPTDDAAARETVRAALRTTQEQETASVRLRSETRVGDRSLTTRGEGVVSLAEQGGDSRLRLVLASGEETEVLVVDGVSYARLPEGVETGLPPETAGKYVRVDPEQVGASGADGSDVGSSLSQLERADEVQRVGDGEVEGSPTTDYRLVLRAEDLGADAATALPPGVEELVYELAVDREGLVREVRSEVALGDGSGAVTSVTVTYVELGVPLDVTAPPESEVVSPEEVPGGAPPPPPGSEGDEADGSDAAG